MKICPLALGREAACLAVGKETRMAHGNVGAYQLRHAFYLCMLCSFLHQVG